MPCLMARPDRGRTCASMPAGSAIARPVGARYRPMGGIVTASPAHAATRRRHSRAQSARTLLTSCALRDFSAQAAAVELRLIAALAAGSVNPRSAYPVCHDDLDFIRVPAHPCDDVTGCGVGRE